MPPPILDDPSGVLPDTDQIAPKWQLLASIDRESPDFLPLLSSLARTDRYLTTKLRGDDAKITLCALDEVSYPFPATSLKNSQQ